MTAIKESIVSPRRYATIVADPPWTIKHVIGSGGRRARTTQVPYECEVAARRCAQETLGVVDTEVKPEAREPDQGLFGEAA